MAKLTKADREVLARALYHAERAAKYLASPTVTVARVDTQATTTLHYERDSDGRVLYEVCKEIGSDLTGLADTIKILGQYLATH